MTDIARAGSVELQRELRDLLRLAVVGDHVRWALIDDSEIAAWLAETVPEWRALADRVAERLVALGIPPDGRVRSLAEDIPPWVPAGWLDHEQAQRLLTGRLQLLSAWARLRSSQAADGDTARLLESVAARLEHSSARLVATGVPGAIDSSASETVV